MSVIEFLSTELGKNEADIILFLRDAPKKYKVYTIPKRTSGHRVIAQPSRELKSYQYKYLDHCSFPIHDAATAYRIGLSIKDNADRHRKNKYLLKIDLENFFNSITNTLFWDVYNQKLPVLSDRDKWAVEQLLFWAPSKSLKGKLILSVGAPSSPIISNFIMYSFDDAISDLCFRLGITYTRYADDLTFSTDVKDTLFSIPELVSERLKYIYNGNLRINRRKTIFSSKAHNRHVTGLTINNHGQLSLGRKSKRYIKHLVHKFKSNDLSQDDLLYLKGILAYARHVEYSFIESLLDKYSAETINEIIKG